MAAAALLLYVVVFLGEIRGVRQLVDENILAHESPWNAAPAPGPIANAFTRDVVSLFVPWLAVVRDAWTHLRLPLWNPYTLSGSPLLANDQSAPFSPFTWLAMAWGGARGLTIAMLARPLVAATGMGWWCRRLGLSPAATCLAAVAFASSSFLTVWLAWPQSAVAACFPWCFAAVEWTLATRRAVAVAALAATVAVTFLAGHAETSLHLGPVLVVYAVVRTAAVGGRRPGAWLRVAGGGALGLLLSAAQLVPFLDDLAGSSLSQDRISQRAGEAHLDTAAIAAWLIPNADGNPGIDHLSGRAPNYLEATGFAGVGALLLAAVGAAVLCRRRPSVGLPLLGAVALAVAQVYTPLAGTIGALPLLDSSNNARMIVIPCLCLPVMAGAGLDALVAAGRGRGPRLRAVAAAALLAGGAAVATLAALALVLKRRGGTVDQVLAPVGGAIGFWVLVAALSVVAAVLLGAAAVGGRGRAAAPALLALAVVEAVLFMVPFNPRVPVAGLPPESALLRGVAASIGDQSFAAQRTIALPNQSDVYRLHDVRGNDALESPRIRLFWSAADSGYSDGALLTVLERPATAWLRAAGVAVWVGHEDSLPAGLVIVGRAPDVVAASVPDPRPFAFTVAAAAVTRAAGAAQATALLRPDPLGTVVVEDGGSGGAAPGGVDAVTPAAAVRRPDPETVEVDVDRPDAGELVVLQSYATGWEATVDGRQSTLLPADVLFQGIAVPAGRHHIVLSYRPRAMSVGLALSAVGVALTVGLLAGPRLAAQVAGRRQRRQPAL